MLMIRAVTFDLDGTVFDSTEAIVESFMHTFEVLGEPPPPRDAVVRSIGYVLEDQFALFTKRDPSECVRIYRDWYSTIACEKTTLLPGAEDSLSRLRAAGLKLGFATSKGRVYAEMILSHLGVLHYFESRIGPDEVTHPKPHPEAVWKSLEKLEVSCDEMFLVGDTHFDVLAARAAAVRCVCVCTGYNSREELVALQPEAVFDSLTEATAYMLAHLGSPQNPGKA
jgi:phosphoglycolate phosphatase-like HAD superfamily hydrolase